jgi:PPK2 family polyphosphate:nucleotide phosphotransferase
MKFSTLNERFRIDDPKSFRLSSQRCDDTCGLDIGKEEAKLLLSEGVKRLSELQQRLYPQDRWAVLAIFQGMDAAGKDSAIKHVMSGVNPQGCEVYSFKAPSSQELDHDFMWRTTLRLPERGRIGIFNRSYYEEVLVVRVHPEILQRQKLPVKLVTPRIWQERFEDVCAFERYLARNGTVIRKFFLNISKEEQRRRFLERIDDPTKRWKFSTTDVGERQLWDRYISAYEDMIRHTSTPDAPWFVIPADHKWFTRLAVAAVLVEALEALDLELPKLEGVDLEKLAAARSALLAEKQ